MKPHQSRALHPTEKPVELAEYLVRTYSNEGELVLDPCFGVGWTPVACCRTGRRFVGMELNPEYFAIAEKRLQDELGKTKIERWF